MNEHASEPHYLSIASVADKLRRRELSPVEVVSAQLQRIEQLEPRLHSYTTVMAESAQRAAAMAEREIVRREYRGPLHGVPIAIKDLCFTHDAPTTGGMPLLHAHTNPGYDATVVARLRAAGAIVLGKLALTEGATGEHHPAVTAPINPWHAAYWTGVSSSGSGVATAAGLCFGSIGSDTAGSIRLPSACCGVTGLKPTWGRISRHGIFHFAQSMDHLGPMARCAEDVAMLLQVLAGTDPNDPTAAPVTVPDYMKTLQRGVDGLRVGIDREYALGDADADVVEATLALLAQLDASGAAICDIRMPDTRAALKAFMPILSAEIAVAHRETYPARADAYGPPLRGMLEFGHRLSAAELARAQLVREDFRARLQHLWQEIDVLVLPVFRRCAPSLEQNERVSNDPKQRGAVVEFTVPLDLSGSPSLTVPAGFDRNGLPVGVQLIGPHFSEDILLAAGYAFQRRTEWHLRHPAL